MNQLLCIACLHSKVDSKKTRIDALIVHHGDAKLKEAVMIMNKLGRKEKTYLVIRKGVAVVKLLVGKDKARALSWLVRRDPAPCAVSVVTKI